MPVWRCHGGMRRKRERERCSLEILLIKKEANLSGREMDEEEVGNGDIQGAT